MYKIFISYVGTKIVYLPAFPCFDLTTPLFLFPPHGTTPVVPSPFTPALPTSCGKHIAVSESSLWWSSGPFRLIVRREGDRQSDYHSHNPRQCEINNWIEFFSEIIIIHDIIIITGKIEDLQARLAIGCFFIIKIKNLLLQTK